MSEKEKVTFKPFTVKHLLQKDEKKEQEKKAVGNFKANDSQRGNEARRNGTQAPIFSPSQKEDRNSQALNLAERLAGD